MPRAGNILGDGLVEKTGKEIGLDPASGEGVYLERVMGGRGRVEKIILEG